MKLYTKREFFVGVGAAAAFGALATSFVKCESADPEPNEAAPNAVDFGRRYVLVQPTEEFSMGGRGPTLVGHSWTDDNELIWHVYEPRTGADVEYRRFATIESRRFMLLQAVPYPNGSGFSFCVHALDAKVTAKEGAGGRRYLDVEVDHAALPKGWETMALWVREDGVLT